MSQDYCKGGSLARLTPVCTSHPPLGNGPATIAQTISGCPSRRKHIGNGNRLSGLQMHKAIIKINALDARRGGVTHC